MVDLLVELVKALLIIFPAYAANGFPPLARGRRPIDFHRKFPDGSRILGEGKTIEGFSLGVVAGTLIGALETLVYPSIDAYASSYGVYIPPMTLQIGFLISFGALVGDLVGSFIKRRMHLPRGKEVIFLDQWNFIVGSIAFVFLITPITCYMVFIMLAITLVVHRFANIVGHKLKVKKVPW